MSPKAVNRVKRTFTKADIDRFCIEGQAWVKRKRTRNIKRLYETCPHGGFLACYLRLWAENPGDLLISEPWVRDFPLYRYTCPSHEGWTLLLRKQWADAIRARYDWQGKPRIATESPYGKR
jgi:hypothetical protein